jgi:TonB family protein
MILAIAVIVAVPILLKYGDKDSDQSSNQIAPAKQAPGDQTKAEPANGAGITGMEAAAVQPFNPVERKPRLVRQPYPGYPEIAQHARLEGRVLVKVLVDKHGHPTRAFVIKSDQEIFNETAKKAAMESRFRPAVMNSNPVKCWVLIPYKFTLG